MDIITFAHQIIDLREENLGLKKRVEELEEIEKKYDELVKSSLQHAEAMGARQLEFLLSQSFTEAKAARLEGIPLTRSNPPSLAEASAQMLQEVE